MADEEQKKIFSKNLNKYLSLNNKTQKEVADMLGISQSYISRLEKRIIGRLKKEIAKMC